MRQFNAITKSFQSSIPQTWSQRKINCHQKFTDVLRRRKWGRRLIYQAMQSNITLKAFWRGMTEQLVSREPFVWDLQGLGNNRIHQTPHSTKTFLRPLLSFLWNYFCKSLSGSLSDSKSMLSWSCWPPTVLGVSTSAQGPNVWCPKHAEVSRSCPFQTQLRNTKEKQSKVMSSPGPQTQETLRKDYSTQAMRKPPLIPKQL